MKRILPYSTLSEREVPEAVDFRILARAAARSRTRRLRRRVSIWGGIAAAVAVTALGGVFFQTGNGARSAERSELLALGDFSRLDQNGYAMALEVGAGNVELTRF